MAIALIAFNGTRVFAMDNNTGIGHWVGSGGTPAAEAQNAYQNSLAVNKKVTASVLTGIDLDPAPTVLDMTAAANKLWFVKLYVADFGDVDATFGVSAGVGSSNADYHKYNLAGSGAKVTRFSEYPAQGGYILAVIDPNIAAWRDSTTGTPVLTAIDWYGGQCAMVIGGAKSENFAIDSIDVGTGLTITAGDGVSTEGNFTDFVAFDQNIKANRYGGVTGSGKGVKAQCLLTIGGAAVTEFLDNDSTVNFLDGYHSAGLVGVHVDMGNASSIINIGSLIIGEGSVQVLAADDTRPDFVQDGVLGVVNFYGNLRNHRNVEFSSIADVFDADIECQLLTQNSCNINDTTIRTTSLTSIACLQDPIFGTTTDLHDVDFVQAGVGHAIEIATATSYTLTNITFTDYGTDTTDSAAIDVTASSGTVTLNIIGGSTPTFKTAGATVVIVANPVTTKIAVTDSTDKSVVQGAAVTIRVGDTVGGLPFEDIVTITRVGSVATVAHTGHGLSTGNKVEIENASENEYNRIKTITVVDANSYTFVVSGTPATPATGTITSTALILDGLTDVLGEISDTRTYSVDQSFTGSVKKGSGQPVFVSQDLADTISKDNGFSQTVSLIPD